MRGPGKGGSMAHALSGHRAHPTLSGERHVAKCGATENTMKSILLSAALLASAFSIAGCKGKDPAPAPAPQAAEVVSADAKTAADQITADFLRSTITTLSSDEFEGRGPATAGELLLLELGRRRG